MVRDFACLNLFFGKIWIVREIELVECEVLFLAGKEFVVIILLVRSISACDQVRRIIDLLGTTAEILGLSFSPEIFLASPHIYFDLSRRL